MKKSKLLDVIISSSLKFPQTSPARWEDEDIKNSDERWEKRIENSIALHETIESLCARSLATLTRWHHPLWLNFQTHFQSTV